MTDRNRDEKRNPREKNKPGQKSGQKSAQHRDDQRRDDRRDAGGSQAARQKEDSPSQSSRTEIERERSQGGQASRGEAQRDEQGQFLPEDRSNLSDRADRSEPADRSGGAQGDNRSGRAQQSPDRQSPGRIPASDEDVDSSSRHGERPDQAREERNRKSGS